MSVAIWDNESGQGLIVVGFENGTIKAWDAGIPQPTIFLTQPKTKCPHACHSFPGAQGGEAERAQQWGDVRGLFP